MPPLQIETGTKVVEYRDTAENRLRPPTRTLMASAADQRHPVTAVFVAVRQSVCSHPEYLYFSETVLSKCVQELQHMQLAINDHQRLSRQATTNTSTDESSTLHCSRHWWQHLVAGGAAGAVSRTCTAPLDRLKCMLMVYGSRTNNLRLVAVIRQMLEEGGVASLWRGNAINIVKVVPEMALKFMVYEQIKCGMKVLSGNPSRDLGIAERFVAGSLAGATAQSIIYPLEVLKTRLVLRKTGQYKSIVHCAQSIWQREGARGFYRGYIPNMLGILPYAGIDLAIYETLKRQYMSRQSSDSPPTTLVLLICGVVSSSCGQLASYPLTLVRTRLQANVTVDGAGTMSGTFRTILMTDGISGLYRGIAANFLKVAPAVGISYVIYEKTRGVLGATMT